MNDSRRNFLKQSGLLMAGMAFAPKNLLALAKPKNIVSVQLYSVRDDMSKNPIETLKKVAAIGYKDVEHAGYRDGKYYGIAPKEFRKVLDDLGITMQSGHSVLNKEHWDEAKNDFTDVWKKTIDDAAIAGQKYIISPWLDAGLRKNFDDLKRFMDVFNKCGELCKKSGIRYGYHNHDFEFSLKLSSKKVYDIIMENTDPKLVAQQLDIGNMYGGGGRAVELLKQYPNRFELMHVKDELPTETHHESTILGTGIIGVKEVLELAQKQGGTFYLIVEQEAYQGKQPIDCIKEDFDIMKKWGY